MKELYNPQFKERFLNQGGFTKATQYNYSYVFYKTAKWEKRLNKDLSEFTHSEYDKVLSELKAKSRKSIQYQHSILTNYITFAIQNGFASQTINFASAFTPEMLDNYIDRVWVSNEFVAREDLNEIIAVCENMQDAATVVLIYNIGIANALEESRNLKGKDIDKANSLVTLTRDDGSKRIIELEDNHIEVLYDAFLETEYKKDNGVENSRLKAKTSKLQDSEYVLKNVVRKDSPNSKVSPQLIRQRLKRVGEYIDNEYISPTSIMISGMVEYTKKYMQEQNKEFKELDMYDFIKIIDRFGITENNWHTNKERLSRYLGETDS